MAVAIYDESAGLDLKLIERVYRGALEYFSLPDCFETELSVAEEDEIRQVNAHTRGIDSVTDVLSFPATDFTFPFVRENFDEVDPETGNVILGEIMICSARARAQAEEYGHSYERECAYLFLHGLLHLMGFDHVSDEDRAKMREAEENILNQLGVTRTA